ncbi:hypothetical protein ACWOFR_15055 [Carnobacterium gallinarum]|uniref:hypothetical protein n=1 Tax=Carnobacterium gallinarum TaxID=2749 RepID=UPI00054E7F8A|nr:hypothetical protein [Carnobacterium gallinarum]
MSESSKEKDEKIKITFKPQIIEDTKNITSQMVDTVKVTLNDLITDSVSKVNELNIQRFEEKQAELELEYQTKISELISEYDEKKNELNRKIAAKEEAILENAKMQAELILQNAFSESNEMYDAVQNEITELKEQLVRYQKEVEHEKQRQDNELSKRLDDLNQLYQEKQSELEASLSEKEQALLYEARLEADRTRSQAKAESTQLLVETQLELNDLKTGTAHELLSEKAEHQAKLSADFLRLNREKEWFLLYQEQVEQRYAEKEQELYQRTQAELDELQLKVQELQNQTDFYHDMDEERKDKSFSIGLYICILSGASVVVISLLKQSSVIFPIFSAFLGAYLIYTTLTDGRFERHTKKLTKKNEWLIEKNEQLKKQMEELVQQLNETTVERNQLAEARNKEEIRVENIERLQETIRKQVTERRLVESENIVLRKRLMDQMKAKNE